MENSINSNDSLEQQPLNKQDSNDKKKVTSRKFPEIKTKLKRFDRLACCFFMLTLLFMIGILIAFVCIYKELNSQQKVNKNCSYIIELNFGINFKIVFSKIKSSILK